MLISVLLVLQAEAVDALRKTRAEASYEVTFTSTTSIGRGDPLHRKGTVRWWKAGVIIVESEGSGQERVRAVRAGVKYQCANHEADFKSAPCETCGTPRLPTQHPRVWVHDLGAWTTADEAGNSAAANGFQNPDELLRLMEAHAEKALPIKGGWEIAFEGNDALKIANRLDPNRNFVAQKAALSAHMKVALGRVVSIDVKAALATPEGAVTFTASSQIAQFGRVAVPLQLGTAKEPVLFNADVAAALAQQLR